jgi:hypothetical protein
LPVFEFRRHLSVIVFLIIVSGIASVILLLNADKTPSAAITPRVETPEKTTTSPEVVIPEVKPQPPTVAWHDSFDGAALDLQNWRVISEGDFREQAVDVVNGRLRLRADTVATDDRTVKSLGVESLQQTMLPATYSATLDWNKQINGSYLSAEMQLVSQAADKSAVTLSVQYLGVPPGNNGRLLVTRQAHPGLPEVLFNEGWPEKQKEGRPLGVMRVRVVADVDRVQVWENDRLLFERETSLPTAGTLVRLLLKSHSNYPAREIFFDDVSITSSPILSTSK